MTNGRLRLRGRRRAALVVAALGLAAIAAACGPAAPPAHCMPDALTSTVLNRTNADRGAHGLGPVGWDGRLACLADEWSRYMRDTGSFRHRDLGATIRSPGFEGYASLAENILVGPGSMDGNSMQNAWMNSSGHRANILGNYNLIGVGYARGGDGRLWATANFGRGF